LSKNKIKGENNMSIVETIVKEGIKIIPSIWDKISEIYKVHINRNNFLHICLYEVKINLDIIATLKTKELRNHINSPAFATLIDSFQTKAITLLMIGNDRKNYKHFLQLLNENQENQENTEELEQEENEEAIKEDKVKKKDKEEINDILDNFNFVIHKIEALRYISNIAQSGTDFLKDFNFTSRINNIERSLVSISNCLKNIISKQNKKDLK